MSGFQSFKDHFLLAMPGLTDPMFGHSLIYLCEHTDEGAMGLVINKATHLLWTEIFASLGLETGRESSEHILAGGPVAPDRGFVLHPPGVSWESSMAISDSISLTTSLDIIAALAKGEGPQPCLVTLGYSGWSGGQLEQELMSNSWLTVAADPHILFHTPAEQRLDAAARTLGIDINLLGDNAGHA
ncbi:MAG: YqgE/AlgH family protein [Pseudomonadales bacterium]